eukprot:2704100-Rhodomonas_salina.1
MEGEVHERMKERSRGRGVDLEGEQTREPTRTRPGRGNTRSGRGADGQRWAREQCVCAGGVHLGAQARGRDRGGRG